MAAVGYYEPTPAARRPILRCRVVLVVALSVVLVLSGCAREDPVEDLTLHERFSDAFLVGTAVEPRHVDGRDPIGLVLLRTHFNSLTAENVMKWQSLQPTEGSFRFDEADAIVGFAEAHDLLVVGHTLVWHHQTPSWVFEDDEGEPVDRETLLDRMRDHISAVVGRYRGRVVAWDVVNEALNDDGTMRDSPWREIIGDDYVAAAFRFAHEADPDAALFYNDYGLERPAKRAGMVDLVSSLLAEGVPVTGVGIQGHSSLEHPRLAELADTIDAIADLGLDVAISELDVDVLPSDDEVFDADVSRRAELREGLDPYPFGLPGYRQQELSDRYAELFELFEDRRDAIARVTLWGLHDGTTWLNDWPIEGRTNHPLIFDRWGQPKPAFEAVMEERDIPRDARPVVIAVAALVVVGLALFAGLRRRQRPPAQPPRSGSGPPSPAPPPPLEKTRLP